MFYRKYADNAVYIYLTSTSYSSFIISMACYYIAIHAIISISLIFSYFFILTKLHPNSISSTIPAIKYAQFNPPNVKKYMKQY